MNISTTPSSPPPHLSLIATEKATKKNHGKHSTTKSIDSANIGNRSSGLHVSFFTNFQVLVRIELQASEHLSLIHI